MKVTVLTVKKTDKDFNIVHVKAGQLVGQMLATLDVTEPGEYWLKTTLVEKAGRLEVKGRVEKLPA